MLASFDLVQHVVGPTQRHSNTLDLILMPSQFTLLRVYVERAYMFSDYSAVVSWLPLAVPHAVYGIVRIDPLCFLARCCKRQLNQALSVLSLSLDFF